MISMVEALREYMGVHMGGRIGVSLVSLPSIFGQQDCASPHGDFLPEVGRYELNILHGSFGLL